MNVSAQADLTPSALPNMSLITKYGQQDGDGGDELMMCLSHNVWLHSSLIISYDDNKVGEKGRSWLLFNEYVLPPGVLLLRTYPCWSFQSTGGKSQSLIE